MQELILNECDCDSGRDYVSSCCFNPIINFVCQLCREQFENVDKLILHKRQGHTVAELKGIKFITFEERFYENDVGITNEQENEAEHNHNHNHNLQQTFEASEEPETTIKIETIDGDDDTDGDLLGISLAMIKTELVEFGIDDLRSNFDQQDVALIPVPVTFEKIGKIDTDTVESGDPNSVNDGKANADPDIIACTGADGGVPSFSDSEQAQSNQSPTDAAALLNDTTVNVNENTSAGLVLQTRAQKCNVKNPHPLKHECTVCKAHYPTKSSLKFHLNLIHGVIIKRSATNTKPKTPRKPCSECPRTFVNQYHLNQHSKSQHGLEIPAVLSSEPKIRSEPQECGECGKLLSCLGTLNRHKLLQHSVNCTRYFCPHCGVYGAKQSSDLRKHIENKRCKALQKPEDGKRNLRKLKILKSA